MNSSTLNTQVVDESSVHEMVVIHRIFRRGFPLLADLVRRCPEGHSGRAQSIAEHADFMISGLHNHHSAEDDGLWPLLLERARPHADLVHRMEQQHHVIGEYISRAQGLLTSWRVTPTTSSGNDLAGTFVQLSQALAEHLDDEEIHILPLVSRHITAAEWRTLGDAPFAKFTNDEKLIALGQMLDVATPDEAASFLSKLPPSIRLIWQLAGRRRYVRYLRRVHGQDRPAVRRWMRRANRLGVALYRRSGGRIGGTAKGVPVLLLTVPGRRTGTPHTVPVAYLHHDNAYLVAGSGGGFKAEPQWFRNLRAAQRVHIQTGANGYDASCRIAEADERDRLWHGVVLPQVPFFTTYQQRSGRLIPLAILSVEQRDENQRGG